MGKRKKNRNTGIKRNKPFIKRMKKSLLFEVSVVLLMFALLIGRILYIIDEYSDQYSKKVLAQQTYVSNPILYKRGEIKDRNGTSLAVSVEVFDVIISPKTILEEENAADKDYTLDAINQFFGISRDIIISGIEENPESQYLQVNRIKALPEEQVPNVKGLTEEQVAPFNEYVAAAKKASSEAGKDTHVNKVVGVWVEKRYARNYPLGNSACDVVGFTLGEHGERGIEQYYDEQLVGTIGREYGYFDSELNLKRTIKPATDGNNVISCIDANVQGIVEGKIQNFMNTTGAKKVQVLLMNPNNGEILTMASNKQYDLNNPTKIPDDYDFETLVDDPRVDVTKFGQSESRNYYWLNFGIGITYEPGSTFKPFTVAAALDEGVINQETVYQCNGVMTVANRQIGCANRIVHGAVTPRTALMQSCNCTLLQIGAGLGRTQFYKYVKNFNFGSSTGIDLYSEQKGVIHEENKLNVVELATSSFGQTQNVTAVQMITAFNSLINGGYYYQPHLVKEIQSPSGSLIYKNRGNVLRQTVTKQTSDFIRMALKDTVLDGTAKPAAIEGYDIGGKTGTAEKGKRDEKKYIVSFIGFAPTENPQVSIYVVIDEPAVEDQAHSTYATELAHDILKDVLPFLGVYQETN